MIHDNTWDNVMKRITAYSVNLTVADAHWYHRCQELEAICFSKEDVVPRFFTFSFVDYYWDDLHRMMPGGLVEPNRHYRNVAKISIWLAGTFGLFE